MNSQTIASASRRQDLLRSALVSQRLDVLLVSNEKDIRYLTGFLGHDSLLLVFADGGAAIVSDPRYDEFLDPWRGTALAEVVMGKRHRLEETVATVASARSVKRLGVQGEFMTLAQRSKLAGPLQGEIVETQGLVGTLRMKKDAGEVALIERAIRIQEQAIDAALAQLVPGLSEMQFCALLEYEMKIRGSFNPSFDTMVCSGPASSVIHYQTSENIIGEGVLMVDWGATVDGYCSDMTRTFLLGTPGSWPQRIREIYEIVLDAQLAAIDAIAPGKTCAEIDEVARRTIREAGYGEYFGHGLGHGLGLDIHEPPFFNDLQTDIILEPGMVMTVEPGIYLPGVGGVRIEDDIVVTDAGARVLCTYPKELERVEVGFGASRDAAHSGAGGNAR